MLPKYPITRAEINKKAFRLGKAFLYIFFDYLLFDSLNVITCTGINFNPIAFITE
jgi:hypothetical protein